MNLMKTLAHYEWGADSTTLLRLYKATIRSKLDYGAVAYSSANRTLLKTLNSIHNTAIRIALGAHYTSPIESLYCEAAEPSLYLRRQYLSLSYAVTISANPENPTHTSIFSNRFASIYTNRTRKDIPFYARINKCLTDLEINLPKTYSQNINTPPPWTVRLPSCDTELTRYKKSEYNHQLIRSHFQQVLDRKYQGYTTIYTDASKTEEGVGAAFITSNSTHQFKLPVCTTIYTGELYAVLQALTYTKQQHNQKTLILSDSLSTIQGLKQLYPNNPMLLEIKTELLSIHKSNREVKFMWVPSHTGIQGNEEADKAAQSAISQENSTIVTVTLHTDLKQYLKKEVEKQWQTQWSHSTSKLREIKTTVTPWSSVPNCRKDQIMLSRLRIGHTKLTHDYLIKREVEPTCDFCDTKLTVKHLLVECPYRSSERQNRRIPQNLREILDDNCNLKNLKLFLSDINVLKDIM